MSGVYDCDMKGEGLSSFHISIFQFLRFYLCLCCVILSFVALDYNSYRGAAPQKVDTERWKTDGK